MSDKTKSKAYWEGVVRDETARFIAAKKRAGAALDANLNLPEIARQVADHLGRDNARKQRVYQRSPHVFSAMDAEELAQASSREMAIRELTELGIDCGDNDPVAILDAHHAGRQYARDGGRSAGMDSAAAGSAQALIDKIFNGG